MKVNTMKKNGVIQLRLGSIFKPKAYAGLVQNGSPAGLTAV